MKTYKTNNIKNITVNHHYTFYNCIRNITVNNESQNKKNDKQERLFDEVITFISVLENLNKWKELIIPVFGYFLDHFK